MTQIKDIYDFFEDHPEAQEVLDGFVHEEASNLATAVNNDGIKSQLDFLNRRGHDDAYVLEYLKEMCEERDDGSD